MFADLFGNNASGGINDLPVATLGTSPIGIEPFYPLQELLRQSLEIPRHIRSPHTIMQCFSHHCEHIMEVVREFLVSPVPLPAAAICEERVNSPTIRVSAA